MVPLKLLESEAYRSLSGSAAKALPHFMRRPKIPTNSRDYHSTIFSFSYREAKRFIGISSRTFSMVIRELVEKGFLDQVSPGCAFEDLKIPNQFRISTRWEKYGTGAFENQEWEKWGAPRKTRHALKSKAISL